MTAATVQLFFGILAVLAVATMAVVAAVWLASGASDSAARVRARIVDAVGPSAVGLAWGVSGLATAGSLYFSEVAGYTPCTLCWYQRIAMYPLVVVLGVGALTRERSAVLAGGLLAAGGALVAAVHVALEWLPTAGGACDPANPCTAIWFRTFGIISLPTLALIAFLLILMLLAIGRSRSRPDAPLGGPA